jgi:hypothetical protein
MSVKNHPLYRAWLNACRNGISDEWRKNFSLFCEEVGQKMDGMSLCRADELKPLSKNNFVWKDNPRRIIHSSLLDVPEKTQKAGKEHHPLYNVHYHYRRVGKLCDEWAKDFWKFAEDVGEMRSGYKFCKIDESKPLSKDNFVWREKIVINSDDRKEKYAAYQRVWRERNKDKDKANELRRRFGIELSEYNQMHDNQGGVCAICGKPETSTIRGKTLQLAVDHCHTTGKIRGLLCSHCNHGIGKFGDKIDLLQKAANYLQSHQDHSS